MKITFKHIRNFLIIILLLVVLFFVSQTAKTYQEQKEIRQEQKRQEQELAQFIQDRLDKADQDNDADPFGEDKIVRVLLIGLDKRIGQTSAHCDAIQMFEVNKEKNTVVITAVPRGTYSPLPPGTAATSSDYYVSNACGKGGIEYGVKQIENILGQQADYLVFVGFSEAIGVFRTLKLPTTETLEWLRHRKGYAVGEPQRAHNHSTFLRQLIINHIPTRDSAIDTPLEYLLYNIIETDLSFSQVQQIIKALIPMELSTKPERITLFMKPEYVVQDIPYNPDTLEEYRHQMIDPIASYLSKLDFAQLTVEEIQTQIISTVQEKKTDPEFISWAWNNKLWYQIEDESLREDMHFTILTQHLTTLNTTSEKQYVIADYILEMEYLGLTEWSEKGKKILEDLLKQS